MAAKQTRRLTKRTQTHTHTNTQTHTHRHTHTHTQTNSHRHFCMHAAALYISACACCDCADTTFCLADIRNPCNEATHHKMSSETGTLDIQLCWVSKMNK